MKKITFFAFALFLIANVFAQRNVNELGRNNPFISENYSSRSTEDACTQSNASNAFENGSNCSSTTTFHVANDLVVGAGDTFTLNQIVANIFTNGSIASVDVIYYDDVDGPGAELGSELGLVPTTQEVVGANFGIDVHETVLDITPFDFVGGDVTTHFWIELIVTNDAGDGAVYWENSTATQFAKNQANKDTGVSEEWTVSADPVDGVYQFIGECSDVNPYLPPTGCTVFEDFEADTLPEGWSTEVTVGEHDWSFGSGDLPTGDDYTTNAAVFDDDDAGSGQQNTASLSTPVYDLASTYSTFAIFSAYIGFNHVVNDAFTIEVFDGTDWQQVAQYTEDLDPDLQTVEFDATAYINDAFQVRFTFTDNLDGSDTDGMWGWYASVDDFCLKYDTNDPPIECVISEDFEDGMFPEFWRSVVNTGSCDFEFGNDTPTGPDFETVGVFFNDDACGSDGEPSNLQIETSAYGVTGATFMTIGYDLYFQEYDGVETFAVEVYDGTNWNEVAFYNVESTEIFYETIDVTAFINDEFQVRFVYDDGGTWGWGAGIDNFCLNTDGTVDEHQSTVSTFEATIDGFNMFPNPVEDTLNLNAATTIDTVTVYNMLGQEVLVATPSTTQVQMDMSNLQTGAYIVKVQAGTQVGSYNLIKE